MKKRYIVLISLLFVFAIIIVACTQSDMYGRQNDRALKIYEEKQEELYKIIKIFDEFSIDYISKIQYNKNNNLQVDKYYVVFEDGEELTVKKRDQIIKVIEFMKHNKIREISNNTESNLVYFDVMGWTRGVSLIYAPNKPDIDDIRQQNYCNAKYIDESWILLDYYDEDYWS